MWPTMARDTCIRAPAVMIFDLAGNLVFVNWDYQTLMKVTTNLSIPCPHCEKAIPLRLRPRQKPKPNEGTGTKAMGPII